MDLLTALPSVLAAATTEDERADELAANAQAALPFVVLALLVFAVLLFILFLKLRAESGLAPLSLVASGGMAFAAVVLGIAWLDESAFLFLLGMADFDFGGLDENTNFAFGSMPPWGLLLFLIVPVVLGYTIVMYVLERKTVGAFTKSVLVVLRVGAISLLLLMLFEPGLTLTEDNPRHSTVVVLVDTSLSMQQRDLYVDAWQAEGEAPTRVVRSEVSREGLGRLFLERFALDSLIRSKLWMLASSGEEAPSHGTLAKAEILRIHDAAAGEMDADTDSGAGSVPIAADGDATDFGDGNTDMAQLAGKILLALQNELAKLPSSQRDVFADLTSENLAQKLTLFERVAPAASVQAVYERVLIDGHAPPELYEALDPLFTLDFYRTQLMAVDNPAAEWDAYVNSVRARFREHVAALLTDWIENLEPESPQQARRIDSARNALFRGDVGAFLQYVEQLPATHTAFPRLLGALLSDEDTLDNDAAGTLVQLDGAITGILEGQINAVEEIIRTAEIAAAAARADDVDGATNGDAGAPEDGSTDDVIDADGEDVGALTAADIPTYGPSDSFAMLVQWRRLFRLYEELRAGNPRLDLERVLVLARTAGELDAVVVALERSRSATDLERELAEIDRRLRGETGSTSPSAAEIESLHRSRQRVLTDLRDIVGARAVVSIVGASHEEAVIADVQGTPGVEITGAEVPAVDPLQLAKHLVACGDGVRRIDTALELLNPRSRLGESVELPAEISLLQRLEAKGTDERGLKNQVVCYAFHTDLEQSELNLSQVDELEPLGSRTAILESIESALARLAKQHVDPKNVGGVLVVSDGLRNHGRDRQENARIVQLDTIGVGSRETLRRLALSTLSGPDLLAKGARLQLSIKIRADRAYQYPPGWYRGGTLPDGKDVEVLLYRVTESPTGTEEERLLTGYQLLDHTPQMPGSDQIEIRPFGSAATVVSLRPTADTQDLQLQLKPRKGVHFDDWEQLVHYRVRINRRKYVDEDTYQDNVADIWVYFTNKRLRVLHIEGRFRYSERYLSMALRRDVSILYQNFVTTADTGWPQYYSIEPEDPPEDYEPPPPGFGPMTELPPCHTEEQRRNFFDTFDVIILGDVSPKDPAFPDGWFEMVKEWVDKEKGGIIFIAGQNHNPKQYVNTPLEHLLPVKLTMNAGNPVIQPEVEKPYRLTPYGAGEEVFRLHPADERGDNIARWAGKDIRHEGGPRQPGIHGFFWFAPFPEVKPGTITYVEHPGEYEWTDQDRQPHHTQVRTPDGGAYPIMVSMNFGKGMSFYMGTDDFWYIRGGSEPLYAPFYSRLVHWIGSKRRLADDEDAECYTKYRSNPVYRFEEPVEIYARVPGENDRNDLTQAGVLGVDEGGQTLRCVVRCVSNPSIADTRITLTDDLGTGTFRRTYVPSETGAYEVWIDTMPETRHAFQIVPPQLELEERPADFLELMRYAHPRRANVDSDFASHFHLPPFVGRLRVDPIELPDERTQIYEPMWDAPLFFLLALTLLGCEWVIRKRGKLL